VAAIVMGYMSVSIAIGPKADASGWWLAAGFAAAALFCALRAMSDWRLPDARMPQPGPHAASAQRSPPPDAPGAWRGAPVPLEVQIERLKEAGLEMMAGRSVDELLVSWPRADYETDPYNLLLFMYGGEVEAEPWGRYFCERGWNFDMECLSGRGDYVRAFTDIARITGHLQRVSDMVDNFSFNAGTCEIAYTLDGRRKVLRARVDNDWADPKAVAAFMLDLESAIGDGRHFWAADNGQASVLFYLTDAEAAKINALRRDILQRYVLV
jgi:hypothetical protein